MNGKTPFGRKQGLFLKNVTIERCGGGINNESGTPIYATNSIIRDNKGDGIRTNGPVFLESSIVEGNGGHGVHIVMPDELHREIENDIKAGADGRTIAAKFSSALMAVGRSVAGLAEFGANSTQLVSWFNSLKG